MTGGDLNVEQSMPSNHEEIHEVLDDASTEYEEVSVTTAEELQLASAAEINEIEANMGGGETDGTAIVDGTHIRSHKESPQPSPELQPPPHTDDSGIEELLGSSLESLEGDVYSNHTSHSTFEDFGGNSSNDLPDRPALVRKSSWKPQTNLHVHTNTSYSQNYHNEDDQRKRQLEADELVSDDENDDNLHDSPKSLVDDFDADDDIDSDNESEAYSQKFKQHPTDEEDNGDEFDDDDDDITDEEDYYGDDNSDDQSMEFFYEEFTLPDKITPIRKNWKVSWFSSMHRRRMEDISEGEEEEETPDQDDGNNSEGSMSLGGTKGGKSNDLNKSWSSLDNHKKSWHSQRSARKARSDENGSMSNGSLRNEPMGDDESMPLKLSPNQSPNSKRKRHKRGLQLDDIGERDKEMLAKEVRSKEAEEEHELNDSFRTMKRTALVKAKKKSAERKEARKKKKEKGKKKKKVPPPPDGATGTSMKRTKTQLPADSPKPRKRKVKDKSASTKGKVGAETQDDKSTRSKSRSKRKPKAAHPPADEGGADPDASKSKRKANLKVDTDMDADSSVRSASKSRRKAKTNDIEDDKNRAKSPSASKRRLKTKSKESLPTSDNQKKDKTASPKSPRRKLSKKMNKENPDDASLSSHKKKKSRSKSPKGRRDHTQPKSLSDIVSPSLGNEDDEGSERTDSRRGGRRPRPQTTGEASTESRKSRKPKSINDLKSPTQKRKKNRSNTSLKVVPEDESSNAQQQPSSLEALEIMTEEKLRNNVASGQPNEDNVNSSLGNGKTDRLPIDCSSKSAGTPVPSPQDNNDDSLDNSKLNSNDEVVDDAVGDSSAKKGGSGKKKAGFLKSFLSPRKMFKKKRKDGGDSTSVDGKATQNAAAQIDPSRQLNTETSSTSKKPSSIEKIVSNDEATIGNADEESPVELNKIMGKLNDSFQQLNEGFATMVKTIEKVSVENPKIIVRSESSLSQKSAGANIEDEVPLESASVSRSSKSLSRAGHPMAISDTNVPPKGEKKMSYDVSSHHDNLPALKRSQSFTVQNRSMPGMLKKSLSSASLRESSDYKKKKKSGRMTKKERSFRLSNAEWKSPLGKS